MSRENADLVETLFPKVGLDLVATFRDEDTFAQTREVLSRHCTEDFQHAVVFPAETRTDAGLDGLRRNWLDWLEPWATYRSTVDELIDQDDRIVLLVRNHARREDMEIEVELIGAAILTFRDGKVARWEDYADRGAALEAAGLTERYGEL